MQFRFGRTSSFAAKSRRNPHANKSISRIADHVHRARQRLALESLESRCLLSTLYVATNGSDSGAGSSTSPFQTIQKAVNNARAGDTVIVKAGTYNQGVNMYGLAGGTASNPITVEADPNAAPGSVIVTHVANSNSGPNYDAAAFNIESTGTWIVQGFTINGDGSMQKAGIRVASSNSDQILDNVVNHCFTGIFVSGSNSTVVQGNTCENSTDQHGIYISLNTNGTQVIGNTLFGNNWDGLHMNCLNGSPNQNAVVEDNVIYSNGLSGMDLEGINNATIANNMIYGNSKHGITVHSQDQSNTPDTMNDTFVNNTIISNGMFGIQFQPADTQGQVIFNNIFLNSNSEYGAIGVSGTPSGLVSDYNAVVNDFSQTLGTSQETLAQWQSATGQDKHSIVTSASALFVSGSDLDLKSGSPGIDAGTASLSGRNAPTTDFDQNARPQGGGYDLGALESGNGGADTTPPSLSSIAAGNLTATSATITWSTNEAASSQVDFGASTSYGSSSSLNSSLQTAHSVTLSGLSPNTTYHFRVDSADASGNLAKSSDRTFTTAAAAGDTTAPTATVSSAGPITPGSDAYTFSVTYADNKAVSASSVPGATLTVTGPNSFSQTASLVSVSRNTDGSPIVATYQVTEPSGIWSALDNGSYVVSVGANQLLDTSGNALAGGRIGAFNFSLTDTTPLTASAVSVAAQSTQAVITWTTNKPGTSEVDYGTTTSYGQSSAYDGTLAASHSVTLTGLASGTVYHYRVKSWDASNNHLVSTDFTFTTASANGDTTAPTAAVNPGASIANGASTYTFSVTYADNTAVKASTIGSNNLLVTGPNGFSQVANLISASSSSDSSSITGTYQIVAPGGAWNYSDNGKYTIAMQANQVTDVAGNAVAKGSLGTFSVNLAAPVVGDINGDGVVDFGDLTIELQNYGASVPKSTHGDINGDGVVDFSDFSTLLQNYSD